MKPCLLAGGELESVLWERPINLAPKADFNHGFIGLFHWGMGFCSTAVESVGDAVAGRKFSKIYIDHTVGSKKTNSGRESYDDFRTFYFLCMERYLFIRVIMP